MEENNFTFLRQQMVELQIAARGISHQALLKSMNTVPRHLFVPEHLQDCAYNDCPQPIGEDQTISQPYIVALMIQMADPLPNTHVLDVGTGSGYAAAVLSHMVAEVYTIERIATLAETAEHLLRNLHCNNVYFKIGDGVGITQSNMSIPRITASIILRGVPTPIR